MSKRPLEPEVEWTVDQAPEDAEVSPPSAALHSPPRRSRLSRRHFAWATGLLALVLLAALGLWAFTRAGWNRLRAQVAAEVAYEDEQSLARQPDLVRGLQSPENETWLDVRGAEAALGLPAPRPAPHLAPGAEPAQILDFEAAGQDRFEVSVVRAYAEPAGQVYRFTLRQHYRTLGPGLWERLPPDEAALIATTGWQGARLAATLPAADQALLSVVLPAVDDYAERACADWGCPAELSVPLVLTGWLAELPLPGPTITAPHPIAFDLALQPNPEPRRLVVGAPSLTGYPLDEAARTAYTNGLSAAVLAFIAGELTGTGRRPADYYLDALIAREERRLGLSSFPIPSLSPATYSSPEVLWGITEWLADAPPEGETARRWAALAFVDFVLKDQAVEFERELLVNLHRRRNVDEWLSGPFGIGAGEILADWDTRLAIQFGGQSSIPLSALDGLAYQCPDQTVLHDGGDTARAPVWPIGDRQELFALHPLALSPDGRHLATVGWTANGRLRLSVWDRTQQTWTHAAEGDNLLLVGWTGDGELLYSARSDQGAINLMAFSPGEAAPERLSDAPLWPDWPSLDSLWSADHRTMALTLVTENAPRPAVWRAAAPGQIQTVAAHAGLYSTLSPDGRRLVYVPWAAGPDDQPFASSIRLVDLAQGADTVLLTRDAISRGASAPAFFSLLHWAPDSRTLAFLAVSMSGSATLHTLDLVSGQLTTVAGGPGHSISPVGFSADGRFLAYLDNLGNTDAIQVMVFDIQSGASMHLTTLTFDHMRRTQSGLLPAYPTGVAAWAPDGHLLALSTPSGIYVADPASGEGRWVTFEPCGRVVWYSIE